jgi:hypothetical protein
MERHGTSNVRTCLYLEGQESLNRFYSKRRIASGEAKREMVDNGRTDYTLIETFSGTSKG